MKKFLVLLLSCILVMMCLTACGEKEETSKDDKEDKVELTLDKEETPAPTEAPTPEPTEVPTPEPTEAPTPTPELTEAPTPEATVVPTGANDEPVIGMKGVPYTVYIEDVGSEKVKVIKIIYGIHGDLAKAKDLVDAAPAAVLFVKEFEVAEDLCEKLAEVGCTATIRQFTNFALGERATDEMLELFESITAPAEEVNSEGEEETNVEENDVEVTEPAEEAPEVNSDEEDDDYYKMGEFGYFKGTGYQVYIETVGDKGKEVKRAYDDFFGDSGTPIKSYEVLTATDLVVWEIYSETMADELNKVLQDAGATSYVKKVDDLNRIPDELICEDEEEIATFIPRDFRMDPMQRNMFVGQMVYGNIAVGDTVYALLEDGTEVELVIRRTYCLSERVDSINAGEWSALMFESDIPGDKACQTVKVIKRAE